MAITMQGSWTVKVKSKSASFAQRVVISGASTGNGIVNGTVGNQVHVTGSQWAISIENRPTGGSFLPSEMQIKFPQIVGNTYQFDIQSNDAGGDSDFNDLIVTCSMPRTANDYLIYGNVSHYKGLCLFNPCWRNWFVIDSFTALKKAVLKPQLKVELEKLYPNRVRLALKSASDEDVNFKPLMIPMESDELIPKAVFDVGEVKEETIKVKTTGNKKEEVRFTSFVTSQPVVSNTSIRAIDFNRPAIADFAATLFPSCQTGKLAFAELKFQEYDRTAQEKTGAPYNGNGVRENLGACAADRNGNYIFRFRRNIFQSIVEGAVDTAVGENVQVSRRPDVIGQLMDGTSVTPLYETAPYWNIPTLRRINICVPKDQAGSVTLSCNNNNNVIQAVGNVELGIPNAAGNRVGFNNFLNAEGIVTALNSDAPSVRCAAWSGNLDIIGCLSNPAIRYYTVRYRKGNGGAWTDIKESLVQSKYLNFPFDRENVEVSANLEINGAGTAKVLTKAFRNVQVEAAIPWTEKSKVTKARLATGNYENGHHQFRIEGFKSNGDKIVAADERINLFIDNTGLEVDIFDEVSLAGTPQGNCALFTVDQSTIGAPITVRFKASHAAGLMNAYSVAMHKGATGAFAVGPNVENAVFVGGQLNNLANRGRRYVHTSNLNCNLNFIGTPNEPSADADGYFTVQLTPTNGQWLDPGQTFCSFGIYLNATMRHTNGYGGYPGPTNAVPVLIGIQQQQ